MAQHKEILDWVARTDLEGLGGGARVLAGLAAEYTCPITAFSIRKFTDRQPWGTPTPKLLPSKSSQSA